MPAGYQQDASRIPAGYHQYGTSMIAPKDSRAGSGRRGFTRVFNAQMLMKKTDSDVFSPQTPGEKNRFY
jgi:hypothetical protein